MAKSSGLVALTSFIAFWSMSAASRIKRANLGDDLKHEQRGLQAKTPLWAQPDLRQTPAAGLVDQKNVSESYRCGEVPRKVLLNLGLIPQKLASARCPRGQAGDHDGFESQEPDELEFLMCGLVSTRKFVVWTPHMIMNTFPKLKALFNLAHGHTTCDFSNAVECEHGFVAHHPQSGASQTRCLPNFDITSQPVPRHMLVDIAISVFEATAENHAIDELSPDEAHMAFGVILGYPKFATREFMMNFAGTRVKDFDSSYERAVKWILKKLDRCCQQTSVRKAISEWAQTTDKRPPSKDPPFLTRTSPFQ